MYQYNKKFYDWIGEMARKDAEIILPYLIEWIKPRSVVDFGCGEGLWLEIAKQIDKTISIFGIVGDYVDRNRLKIPEENFCSCDLSKPLHIKTKYDLAICTEVTELLD